ncbi:MAG: hypothetical protein K2L86_03270 [Lachnospiraceae bacterium]|nr:hypothetical protein [Lachnospiraceae bacterium]
MQQGIDSRAMLTVFLTKLPKLFFLAVAGAVLGSGLYLLIALEASKNACYVSETEYYIEFDEKRYNARDYYNAFTWNDAIKGDELLGRAMERLGSGYDREQVETMITAAILSDVRYLTITIRGRDAAQVEAVKDALGQTLEEFGALKDEFESIYKIRDREIALEKIPYFGWRAAVLGAVIAAALGAFAAAFRFCLGSVFYTKRDITVRLGLPVYGMTVRAANDESTLVRRQGEMLEGSLRMLQQQYRKIVLVDASQGQEASAFLEEIRRRGLADNFMLCDREKDLYGIQDAAFMAVIPFGRNYREKITDEIAYVKLRGGRVVGAVLVQAPAWWMRFYYAQGRP